jgi:hypothetical protein
MEIIEDGKHIARKEHECNFCHGVINIGEEYEYQKNKHDGEFYTWKTHIKCSELATALKMYENCCYDEGLTDDDFYEYISEAISDLTLKEKVDILYELKCKKENNNGN